MVTICCLILLNQQSFIHNKILCKDKTGLGTRSTILVYNCRQLPGLLLWMLVCVDQPL